VCPQNGGYYNHFPGNEFGHVPYNVKTHWRNCPGCVRMYEETADDDGDDGLTDKKAPKKRTYEDEAGPSSASKVLKRLGTHMATRSHGV
jgi:hypothetical protein